MMSMPQFDNDGEWQPLASSNVSAARYVASPSGALGILSVRFASGGEYDYYDVPAEVAAALFVANSPGRYVRDVLSGYSYAGG
jgi:KTSC domain